MKNTNIECRMQAVNEENRTVTFIASTTTKDRHGTVLNQENWQIENFNRNPIVGYQHNVYGGDICNAPNPDSQLGTAKAYLQDEKLMVDITFEPADINPLAEKIFRKIQHGTLRAVSVGFVPILKEDGTEGEMRDGTFYYNGQELLEISVVNIPSNPDALKKSLRASTSNALTFITKKLNKSYSDVENMTVREVLDLLENNKKSYSRLKLQQKRLLLLKMSKH